MEPLPITDRTRLTRAPRRQVTDRRVLHEILDEALVAHVGLVREDGDGSRRTVVLPMGCARDGGSVLLHGSTGGGLLRESAGGAPVTVAVTLLDGLVVARSLFDSSMNYRSVMITGAARTLSGQEKTDALAHLSEHLLPGRGAEVRGMTAREVAATLVLRVPLDEVGVKVRAGAPSTAPDDGESRTVWAGVVPLRTVADDPVRSDDTPPGVGVPASVRAAARRFAPAGR